MWGVADVAEIEERNILNATKLAMKRAYEAMAICDGILLIDAIDPAFLGVRARRDRQRGLQKLCDRRRIHSGKDAQGRSYARIGKTISGVRV